MQCKEFIALLPAYLDGELDLIQSIEVEKHIDTCDTCLQLVENERVLQTAMRTGTLYHAPRTSLERNILRAVQKSERTTGTHPLFGVRRYPFAAAFAALLLLAFWAGGHFQILPSDTGYIAKETSASENISNEALSSHLRSLMADHLTDVVSSDKHTVKPWFNGRVDYSPPVIDMADIGFPLAGGRLDYLDSRSVTALVYRRQKHVINLFLWPVPAPDAKTSLLSRRGYNMIHWTQSGLAYWAVSDLNATELREFSQRYQERVTLSNRP
ncbi:MAG: zinc-finger family protein [Chthonomonadales bacterium]|nr:zinc-finger family protein [Chthonomonadales bacterium]